MESHYFSEATGGPMGDLLPVKAVQRDCERVYQGSIYQGEYLSREDLCEGWREFGLKSHCDYIAH